MSLPRGVPVVGVLVLAGVTLAGCGSAGRPTLEQARAETEAVLQQIADGVPGGVVEVDTPTPPYLTCGEGEYYATIRWAVTARPGFDGEAFIDALPGRLGKEFMVDENVEVKPPGVALDHSGGITLEAKVAETYRGSVLFLIGLTPCAEGDPPAE
ncbi:hypothetical protein [Microbacterium thalli]|uniref:Lipoprotein n=1 Tax=Microbacterium thalli TaxID=3027921 RepID=A0ABT5SMX4_9MICO|nr:hypothetical protein [Microbacterium thalli]MDD7928021.1 hypothetical protein [Microbacterium thalli]MDD7963138.1 hypothetical protein [Microbacterium thalli]MDN8550162.1 hypothetical protein [Microbacterium thalli]